MADFADISIKQHVIAALSEDIGQGDATTEALIAADASGQAQIIAREALVVAGVALAEAVFSELDNEASIDGHIEDGEKVQSGDCLLTVTARLRALLTGERTALNFLQRLSGVATQSARYAEAVSGTGVLILDTRKTTPGWRMLEKYAVQCGGARNHRRGLDDMMLIKDNHLAALSGEDRIAEAVHRARRASPDLKIEVEAETLEQAEQAVEAGADIVLLDNMTIEELRAAVKLINGRTQTEASGGITLENIREGAETGVNYISAGALTHSARAVDISMKINP
ncbi:MAG: carboxylating nicotinate-nucleotide diphosphorylase [Pedosphaera sp.]|nr:carboxylating nicotinate-nucleotide diphosphorylase [Pedosphaera sp.]